MKKIIILLAVFFSTSLFSQSKEGSTTSFNFEGQVAVTSNGKGVWYNMGGPNIKFSLPKIALSIGMFPSLKFQEDAPRPVVIPILGVGPQLHFFKQKRFLLSFPFYYLASHNSWEFTAGIGYVLTKPKT